jgi:diguanylate cyclase
MENLEEDSKRLRKEIQQQRQDSLQDALTGLPNKQSYEEHVNKELARVRRQGHKLSIAIADVDHLKHVNDNHGHGAGDQILKLIAKWMLNRLRESDLIARYSGDEFVIMMADTQQSDAINAMSQMKQEIENTEFKIMNEQFNVTVSLGVTEINQGDFLQSAFQRANEALHKAKSGGRNLVCHVSPEPPDRKRLTRYLCCSLT